MKLSWKKGKKRPLGAISKYPHLPFDQEPQQQQEEEVEDRRTHKEADDNGTTTSDPTTAAAASGDVSDSETSRSLAELFRSQGDKLAEEGCYREALGKWEAALNLLPENAILHEQKAQVLLEVGDAWSSMKAAIRATQLEPTWAEAWITLGRAQLNFGEPDSAIESFDRALAMKPDSKEAREDRQAALSLVKKRKQLHSSGLSVDQNRFAVGDKA